MRHENGVIASEQPENPPSGAKARVNFAGVMRGLKPPPPSENEFFRSQ